MFAAPLEFLGHTVIGSSWSLAAAWINRNPFTALLYAYT